MLIKPSNYKLEFTLKQHTPIIHFQADQPGATLRATELKPKLDRFLIEHVFGNDFEQYKEFLIGYKNIKDSKKREPIESDFNKKISFDYKVKIVNDTSIEQNIDDKNPLYFANMGKESSEKIKQKYSEKNYPVIKFHSFKTIFLEIINKHFEAFLANTNFGTRQSKGFGNFYIKDKYFNKKLIEYKVYNFTSTKSGYEKDIARFYSFLRAGINFPCHDKNKDDECPDGKENEHRRKNTRVYIKAAIFHYAKHLGITWDKKVIKQSYLNNKLRVQQNKHNSPNSPVNYSSDDERLIRDLFGLSSEQSWGSDTVSKSHTNIERFKSPITFKPMIENEKVAVYFWADDKNTKFITDEKEFLIKYNNRGNLRIKTPKTFSFDSFFSFVFQKDISFFSDTKYSSQNEYKELDKILKELRSQV